MSSQKVYALGASSPAGGPTTEKSLVLVIVLILQRINNAVDLLENSPIWRVSVFSAGEFHHTENTYAAWKFSDSY